MFSYNYNKHSVLLSSLVRSLKNSLSVTLLCQYNADLGYCITLCAQVCQLLMFINMLTLNTGYYFITSS